LGYSNPKKIYNKCFIRCDGDGPYLSEISKEKAKSLGTEFTPLEVSLKETVESFKEKGIVNF
jgi:hypothetical protein